MKISRTLVEKFRFISARPYLVEREIFWEKRRQGREGDETVSAMFHIEIRESGCKRRENAGVTRPKRRTILDEAAAAPVATPLI